MKKVKRVVKKVVKKSKKVVSASFKKLVASLNPGNVATAKCAMLAGLEKCIKRVKVPDNDEGNSGLRVKPFNFRQFQTPNKVVTVFVYGSYGKATFQDGRSVTVCCGGNSKQSTPAQAKAFIAKLTPHFVEELGFWVAERSMRQTQEAALVFLRNPLTIKGGRI